MIYTNNKNYAAPFVRAVQNDPYSKGKADFTATGLANPPRALALVEQHRDQLVVDVSNRTASIIGQGMHTIAERAARPEIDICEERFYFEVTVNGKAWLIGAQIDLYEGDTGILWDWKSPKASAFSKKFGGGLKEEWITQLNIGAMGLREKGHKINGLRILALLKDWDKRGLDSKNKCFYMEGYPKHDVLSVDIPIMSDKEILTYVASQIERIIEARESLPLCTPKETWGGNRCRGGWCDAASACDQHKQSLKTGLIYPKGE